jgi:hypothetical protein
MDPRQAGSLGGHISWARTPDRAARTRPARANSPASVDYWLNRQSAALVARPMGERLKAAENAKAAHFRSMAARSHAARKANAA